jgi:cbb3-type cytochrome oxidase maturation protein
MTILYLLIPISLVMSVVALIVFLWSLRNGQYEDLAGAAERVLLDPPGPPVRPMHPERVEPRKSDT